MIPLTKQERLVVFYLAGVLAAGSGTQVLIKRFPDAFQWTRVLPDRMYEEKLDINEASEEELMALPFIGRVTARRIVAYREARGPLYDLAQLKEVKGIGPDKYLKLSAYVTIHEPNPVVP